MRQKLAIFVVMFFLVLILVGLNAATYVQKEKTPDNEVSPNRSTFNSGTTGTQALYALLSETGRNVVRWQQPVEALLTEKRNPPRTFVIIGATRRAISDEETTRILEWVSNGGRLVLIDRDPHAKLVATTSEWKLSLFPQTDLEIFSIDPSDQRSMTATADAARPAQPTILTKNINAVQPSRLASAFGLERPVTDDRSRGPDPHIHSGPASPVDTEFLAPVVHVRQGDRNLVVEAPYGSGEIVFVGDPYIVANGGISLVDNAQLAINILAPDDGLVAFDEYHQGYGSNNNRFLQFFAGTPVVPIFLQAAALVALVLFSQSRRFARPIPEREPDRLSKLEYVSAMAELQQRTRAFDLAIESIYQDFRRRASRLLGVDNTTVSRKDLAVVIAERTKSEASEIYNVMRKCEDIMHGEATDQKETLKLAARIREIEEQLGLKRSRSNRIQ